MFPETSFQTRKEKERIIKQSSPFEKQMQDPAVSVVEKVMANQHESNVKFDNK